MSDDSFGLGFGVPPVVTAGGTPGPSQPVLTASSPSTNLIDLSWTLGDYGGSCNSVDIWRDNAKLVKTNDCATLVYQDDVHDRAQSANGNGGANNWVGSGTFGVTAYPISVSAWIKTDITNVDYYPFCWFVNDGTLTNRFHLLFGGGAVGYAPNQNKAFVGVSTAVGETNSGGGTVNVNDGQWHNILMIITAAEIKKYVDGAEDIAPLANPRPFPANLGSVACFVDSTAQTTMHYHGALDEVAVWATDKSARAAAIYAAGNGVLEGHAEYADAVHHWPLNANRVGGAGIDVIGGLNMSQAGSPIAVPGVPAADSSQSIEYCYDVRVKDIGDQELARSNSDCVTP